MNDDGEVRIDAPDAATASSSQLPASSASQGTAAVDLTCETEEPLGSTMGGDTVCPGGMISRSLARNGDMKGIEPTHVYE